jgi:uncharacterized protein (DUF2235 family)
MKLAVFFDGTWNEPNDRTNVYSLFKRVPDDDQQETYYIEGVGTEGKGLWDSLKRYTGGAFGDGLSANIQDGYQWLCKRFNEGDQIFLFGFSRGAYSARSLSGLIRKCGLVKEPSDAMVKEAYQIYRDKSLPGDDVNRTFRKSFSRETDIEFIGVWDTVGDLGIPIQGIHFPGFASYYQFHDTDLSNHTKAAYHALAANEYRSLYKPTFWTRTNNDRPPTLPVEQRWFIGAHADVGGGYRKNGKLQLLSANWVRTKAIQHGLNVGDTFDVPSNTWKQPPHDSYTQFVGIDPLRKATCKRLPRQISQPAVLNQTLDPSIKTRLNEDKTFLTEWPNLRTDLLTLPIGV